MIKWSELTPEQRNELVARTVFNWQPVECPVIGSDNEHVTIHDNGDRFCDVCGGRGNAVLFHDIVPPKPYSTDMNAVWSILDQEKFYSYYVHCMKAKSTGLKKDQYACSLYWLSEKATLISHCDSTGHTPQEAVCLAALVSYGIEIEDA